MTTYPTSTAPAAKAWLYTQMQSTLTADPDHTFQVAYATETATLGNPDDMVSMGNVSNRLVTRLAFVGGMGQWALQEDYDLSVDITVFRAGEDDPDATTVSTDPAALAEARAWVLAGVVETIVRTDPTLGGLVTTSRPAQTPECDVDWSDDRDGRAAALTVSIHCYSPI